MKKFFLILSLLLLTVIPQMTAQEISPYAEITTEDGEVQSTSYEGSAPLKVRFVSGSDNHDGYFEWRFYKNEIVEEGVR